MIKTFVFVLSILTNNGQLQMKAIPVDKCPDVTEFTQVMDEMMTEKQFLKWNAVCIPPQANT